MKIAFLYMDVTNLGDLVIRDTARYLLDSILDDNDLQDAEVVPVDIGEWNYKQEPDFGKTTFRDRASKKAAKYAKSRKVYRNLPFMAQEMLAWSWHRSKQGRYFRKKEMPKLKGADLIVFGGGGLIKFHKQSFHFILHDVTRYAQHHGIPVIINSVGVEGYSGAKPGCKLLKRALNRPCVKFISSRDDYDLLVGSYVENPDIVTAKVCDPAFWTAEAYKVEKAPEPSGVIGLNVIRPAIFKAYRYAVDVDKLDELYRGLVGRLLSDGYRVDFFSNGVAGDTDYIDHLFETYPELADNEQVSVSKPETPAELVKLISGYERFVAARLHASIVGTVLGVPNVSLVWNDKQVFFGQTIGLRQNYITLRGFDADTVYRHLMAAEPYQMDYAYKQTVRDTFEKAVLDNLATSPEPESGLAWFGQNLSFGFRGFFGDIGKVFRKIGKRRRTKARKRKNHEEFERNCREAAANMQTQPNKIAIMTNTFHYTCNPKYISEELHRRDDDYDIVWLVKNLETAEGYPEGERLAQYNTKEGIEEVFSAKIWLDNGIAFSNKFDKKPDQIHIQTMHGSLGIKRIDNAVLSRNARGESGQRVVRRETENTNYVITNSKFEEDVFRRVFWKDTPMKRLGHARTDILFEDDPKVIAEIRQKLNDEYGIPVHCKLVMFAPTHRKGLTADDIYIDYKRLKATLERKFGGEFAVMVRLHDRTKNLRLEGLDEPFVYDVGTYPDMQELMLVTDVGITDYSSWIFDYVEMKRPGFHYVTDIERYLQNTGLAYPIEESPFPNARTHDELIAAIESFDNDAFVKDVDAFLDEKQAVDDGHSAERIADWFHELVFEGQKE